MCVQEIKQSSLVPSSLSAAVTCSMSSNSSCGTRTGNEAREVGGHKDRESHTGSTWSAYMVSSFSFSAS